MSALVTAADLSDDLSRRAVKVIDVQYNLRGTPGRELYAAAHLPGAPHLDLDASIPLVVIGLIWLILYPKTDVIGEEGR